MLTRSCLLAFALFATSTLHAAEHCQTFHGRARYYSADGQFRIWNIGTHHEFMPPAGPSDQPDGYGSWDQAMDLLTRGNPNPNSPPNDVQLFADFTVCPTEPAHPGAAQRATIKSIQHPHVIPWTN